MSTVWSSLASNSGTTWQCEIWRRLWKKWDITNISVPRMKVKISVQNSVWGLIYWKINHILPNKYYNFTLRQDTCNRILVILNIISSINWWSKLLPLYFQHLIASAGSWFYQLWRLLRTKIWKIWLSGRKLTLSLCWCLLEGSS